MLDMLEALPFILLEVLFSFSDAGLTVSRSVVGVSVTNCSI